MKPKLVLAACLLAAVVLPPAASQSADDPTPTYEQGISFGNPVRMTYSDPTQVGGPGEPSIKVDSRGTIYTAGVCCILRASPAWYSKDNGATFSYLPSPGGAREVGLGAEGDFTIDDADSVYFGDTMIPNILLTKWSGRGDVWEYTNDSITGVLPGLDDRPWLQYAYGNVYMYINHGTHIAVYQSSDGGHSWSMPFQTTSEGQKYWPGNIATDRRRNNVYIFGSCGGGNLCAGRSVNGGAWTQVNNVLHAPRNAIAQFMLSTDVDAAGNLYGAYADINANGCDVYLAVSTDQGQTFRQFRVNPESGCATFPWVAAGDDGRVSVVWYHNPSAKNQNTVPAGSQWREHAAVITGATGDTPTVTHGTLDRVIHTGPLNRELWDFQQIALGPDGRFHIAFVEDFLPGCNGNLSTHGGAAAYQNMCTDYVAQTGGPRAITHAADQTAVDGLNATGGTGSIDVDGATTFGRAQPATVFTNTTVSAPGLDLTSGTIVRPSARSDELVFELRVSGLPEAATGTGQSFSWPIKVDGRDYTVNMTPRPWRFEVCTVPTSCTRVRGDTDAGGDRIVARVPLAALGATNGGTVAKGAWFVASKVSTVEPDRGDMGTTTYPIPVARATVRVTDASGTEVASAPANLSGNLSSFEASLGGLAPGTYTVSVEACFASNCATATQADVVVA